jgi:DivIVA domain-containing protein
MGPDASLSPEAISAQSFTSAFRGYDAGEVKAFLGRVASQLRSWQERAEHLESAWHSAEERAARPPVLDEDTLMAAVGEETAAILRTARASATELRTKAGEESARLLADAQERAERLTSTAGAEAEALVTGARAAAEQTRTEAGEEADALRAEAMEVLAAARAQAEAEAAALVAAARLEAAATLERARTEAEELRAEAERERRHTIEGAHATRDRILDDLGRRRRVATVQIEQLRAGRERLSETYAVVRRTLEEVQNELSRADAEARAAADEVGRRLKDEPDPELTEDHRSAQLTPDEAGASAVDELFARIRATPRSGPDPDAADPAGEVPGADAPGAEPVDADSQPVEPAAGPQPAGPQPFRPEQSVSEPGSPAVPEPGSPAGLEAGSPAGLEAGSPAGSEPAAEAPGAGPAPNVPAADVEPAVSQPVSDGPEPDPSGGDAAERAAAESDPSGGDAAERAAAESEPSGGHAAEPAAAVGVIGTAPVAEAASRPRGKGRRSNAAVEPARAETAVTEVAPGPDAPVPDARRVDGEGPVADEDESLLQRRDEALADLEVALTRRLKRALQDEQNDVLDRLRNLSGRVSSQRLLVGAEEQAARYVDAARPLLADSASAGADFAAQSLGTSLGDLEIAVDDLAIECGQSIVAPLRRRLEQAIDSGSGDDQAVLVEALGSAYRQWKTQRVERLAGDVLSAAFARGTWQTLPEEGRARWVVYDLDGPCPDCDDDALAGAVPASEVFPTGQNHPPAHSGCRCLLVPLT